MAASMEKSMGKPWELSGRAQLEVGDVVVSPWEHRDSRVEVQKSQFTPVGGIEKHLLLPNFTDSCRQLLSFLKTRINS